MLVKTKTACVTCPRLFVRGSLRPPIGAKNARKMCENESMRKTRSVGSFGFDFFDGMCPDDKESRRRVTSYGGTRAFRTKRASVTFGGKPSVRPYARRSYSVRGTA